MVNFHIWRNFLQLGNKHKSESNDTAKFPMTQYAQSNCQPKISGQIGPKIGFPWFLFPFTHLHINFNPNRWLQTSFRRKIKQNLASGPFTTALSQKHFQTDLFCLILPESRDRKQHADWLTRMQVKLRLRDWMARRHLWRQWPRCILIIIMRNRPEPVWSRHAKSDNFWPAMLDQYKWYCAELPAIRTWKLDHYTNWQCAYCWLCWHSLLWQSPIYSIDNWQCC